jgi:cell division protein FtsB
MLPRERKTLNNIRKALALSILLLIFSIAMLINKFKDVEYLRQDNQMEFYDYMEKSEIQTDKIIKLEKEIDSLNKSIKKLKEKPKKKRIQTPTYTILPDSNLTNIKDTL